MKVNKKVLGFTLLVIIFISGFFYYFNQKPKTEKVHFISVNGDCILIESNGHYGLIDGGEDSENPSGKELLAGLVGTENHVLDYLRKNVDKKDGKIHLDFIIGTHSHSDHLGGLRHVVNQTDISVDKVILKEYNSAYMNADNLAWDNQEEYDLFVKAVKNKKIPLLQKEEDINSEFDLGSIHLKLYNLKKLDYPITSETDKIDENVNSICTLLTTKNNHTLFLGGDINYYPNPQYTDGVELNIAKKVGNVDLVKLNHHGYKGSNASEFFDVLRPENAIATFNGEKVSTNTVNSLNKKKINLYTVQDNGDIVVDFSKKDFGLNHYQINK